MRLLSLHALLTIAALLASGPSLAQQYPTKPIRLVIGFPPGTIIDTVARMVGTEMEKQLGQPIVLEFKPGANGTIAAKYVVSSNPDGYTFYYGNVLLAHPLFNRNNAVDAAKELTPVSRFVTLPYFLVARSGLPVKSIQELLAYTKANPGALTHGAPTATTDLLMQMIKDRAGIESRSIPYKASPQILTALLAGEIDTTISSVQAFLPHIQAGTIRALLVTSPRRSPVLPNVATTVDAGLPNFDMALNFGLWAPLQTPKEINQRLSKEASVVLKNPIIVEQILKGSAADAVGSTPEEQMRSFEAETRFWSEAIRRANFQPQ